jgi:hypothetical protein
LRPNSTLTYEKLAEIRLLLGGQTNLPGVLSPPRLSSPLASRQKDADHFSTANSENYVEPTKIYGKKESRGGRKG